MKIDVAKSGFLRFTPHMRQFSEPKTESPEASKEAATPLPLTVAGRLPRVSASKTMTTATSYEPSQATRDQLKAAMQLLFAMSCAIQEAGEMPSGVLYTLVMHVTDLAGYERAIDRLVGAELVVRAPNHLLKWVGPAKEVASAS